ncbi:uncharacterized protein LOC121728253 [Aricia agestis]|uniref:uncharacterized protein LOC121728253 n=1 Tax=Aricia agestis TaxID=91739 RepID=UPI001C2094D6|nr:uncharacterized protein LOC121728253 [Aricia agestis]
MKLLVLTLFSVTLAAASNKAQDGVTDESGNRYGIYETNYRGAYKPIVEYVPERRHPVEYAPERRHPVEYAPERKHPVEYAPERHPVEYAPERIVHPEPRSKIIEEIVLNYAPENYGYRNQHPGYYGYEGVTRYPNYEYRRYGREGLGFDRRTAYALGLRYPVTPKILESVYRPVSHDSRYVLLL